MAMTPKEYDKMLKESSPPTRSGRSLPMAFVVGGLICVVGQALTQCCLSLGLGREEAGAWCSVTLIFLSVLTTGLGWYQRLAKYAGAGTLVPITGFANAMSSPAIEFKSEGMVLGLAAKLFVIAGPVIVYGTVASVLYGLVLVIREPETLCLQAVGAPYACNRVLFVERSGELRLLARLSTSGAEP